MTRFSFTIAAALALVGSAFADCNLENKIDPNDLPEVLDQLCLDQGEGDFTFAMDVSELDVPTFSSGAPWAGLVGNQAFMVYDNTCTLKGVYSPHQTNDCGIPYVIKEDFLPFVLTVTSVNFDVASPSYSFDYANGKFTIKNNGCVCNEVGSGLRVEQGCRCAFPIEGEPEKRDLLSIAFKA